jgi:ubiquinone/menaquinone biosynthesis C-methylase UbiE
MEGQELKLKVYTENEKTHDFCAKNHDRSVPYIHSCRVRKYIWGLITKQIPGGEQGIAGKRVLELGCGTGTFEGLFAKADAESYDGVDLSGEMLKIAKEKSVGKNTAYHKMSLEDFAKQDKKYDIIVSSSFLHHLVDLEQSLQEIKGMLAVDGIYIGVHEVIMGRSMNWIEILDKRLSFLYGYHGQFVKPLRQRCKEFFSNYKICPYVKRRGREWKSYWIFGIIPVWAKRIRKITIEKSVETAELDYVDYQLNFNFDLQGGGGGCEKYGVAIPNNY